MLLLPMSTSKTYLKTHKSFDLPLVRLPHFKRANMYSRSTSGINCMQGQASLNLGQGLSAKQPLHLTPQLRPHARHTAVIPAQSGQSRHKLALVECKHPFFFSSEYSKIQPGLG